MSRKSQFIENTLKIMEYQAQIAEILSERDKEYFDRTYNSGGADEIVDADTAPYDITAAEFTTGITLIGQLKNLFGAGLVTDETDYQATLNKLRRTLSAGQFYDLKL